MIPTKKLGMKIPVLGLGTWNLKGEECEITVKNALRLGYRHIDTGDYYQNHENIGKAMDAFPREKLFITSKVWRDKLARDDVIEECNRFLQELGTDYLDLLLIHWPNESIPMEETFKGMKQLVDDGKVRNVGVSNFTIGHLEEAMSVSEVPIVCNQVEFHPFLYQEGLLDYCKDHSVQLVAYSPLATGNVVDSEVLSEIGKRHNKSAAQVALRWLMQKEVVAIPKSSSEKHLKENMEIFDFSLSADEMARIDGMNSGKRLINPDFAEF